MPCLLTFVDIQNAGLVINCYGLGLSKPDLILKSAQVVQYNYV